MIERPIIFSAPMVRAILDGRKTQTRRVLKHGWATEDLIVSLPDGPNKGLRVLPCKVGDHLWVREAWRASKGYDRYPPREMSHWPVHYEADGPPDPEDELHMNGCLRPSIHMPRWASRITLRVTGVKVERLNEISEEDAKAEGVTRPTVLHDDDGTSYVDAFRDLWFCIHGPGSWEANPWVAAISFEVMK
jgi:hypothetical protein